MFVRLKLAAKKLKGRYGYSEVSLRRKAHKGKIDYFYHKRNMYINWLDIPAYIRRGRTIPKDEIYVNDEEM